MCTRRVLTHPLWHGCACLAIMLLASALLHADEPYGRHQFAGEIREHWSFQPFHRPEVPVNESSPRIANPIDAFVLAGLKSARLEPAPPAERATLLRRVYLDLIGLPHTPAELDSFLADTSPTAFERVVDSLLARPQYGERWARHWLDVVRFAETNGYERDGLKPQAWRYRDWVIDALNADKPYDRFLTEQLAGDEVEGSEAQAQIATTMLRLGPWDDEPADALTDRYDQLDDIVATTSATFLGLTLRCARCHDHKFEPFTQKDYTRWQAIFAPLKRPQNGRTDLDRDIGPHDAVAAHQAAVKALDAQQSQLEDQTRTLAWQVCQRAMTDGRLPATTSAGAVAATSQTAGGETAKPAMDLPAEALMALALEPVKRNDKQKKLLATHASRLDTLVRELADGDARGQWDEAQTQLTALNTKYPPALPKGYIWYEEGPSCEVSHVFGRGDPRAPGDGVSPGFPAVLVDQPPPAPQPSSHSTGRRLALARWLTSPDNPLAARVMVNRLWQHHFGEGIVATENDFGLMGAAPTNQPLLDWLASEFVAGGWQIKRMHRLMVLSRTYQMSSAGNPSAEQIDPAGGLLWRYKPRRVEAETLRDAILAVSGQLNPAGRGPSIYPKISRAVLETQSRPGDGWRASSSIDAARRSVYIFVKRTLLVPELEVLDFPSTEETCEQRVVSTVAPQALTFLNGEFIHEQAQALARRLEREAPDDQGAQIVRAYRLAFSRLPTERELTSVLEFLAKQEAQIAADDPAAAATAGERALAAFCLVLLNTNEFAYLQ
ncbi:MAG TPA: DUF1549 and DUF1553 domain-containing protein [Pirellulales bacterium]|nr:DUF1549 and DUF1553 domain-containing protein [Pirellulales bacterium]